MPSSASPSNGAIAPVFPALTSLSAARLSEDLEVEVLGAGRLEELLVTTATTTMPLTTSPAPLRVQSGFHHADPHRAPLAQHLPLFQVGDINPFAHGISPARWSSASDHRSSCRYPMAPIRRWQNPSAVSFEYSTTASVYDSHPYAGNQIHP
ncbi:hypothetical protein LXA43DRAFT_1094953 [Ganoderma leucocontextum]|nr:hypothetical protein LXA43DRAFT_1094953 [Ganoderma leucocontextum]